PSGCKPTGEICTEDSDCCGGPGNPDEESNVVCQKEGDNPIGRCDNGQSCTPAGGICRLDDTSCSANANCCAGNVLQFMTCAQDNLGIPRCLAAETECDNPEEYEGMACATSADCCGLPCTPSGSGEIMPLLCGGACVQEGNTCTTSADCCSNLPCQIEAGSTQGVCGPPGECAEYGQGCEMSTDCCGDVPCSAAGFCEFIIQ
ncbi:MAG: hypothetical protein KJO07_12005, partial [Deltaproteobacteria bacterium]|nr:hypothetical protein [Deltaproteobacteria bacterium]